MEIKIDEKVKDYIKNKNKKTLKIDFRMVGC